MADLDNEGYVGVVDAARRHVGAEHDAAALAGAELVGRLGTLRLALARVHLQHGDAHGLEELAVELRHARRHKESHDLRAHSPCQV